MIDLTTVFGLVIGIGGLIAGILLEEGNLASYVGISAFVIIAGGTAGATLIATLGATVLLLTAVAQAS